MTFRIDPIGHVRGGRVEPTDDDWGSSMATIELVTARFGAQALVGLDAFSHAEIVYVFDRVAPDEVETGARRPRGRPDWPLTGIFAQRAKNRPNRIGVSVCAIESVVGTRVQVRGLDAIDGTPVVDIKPVMRQFLPRGEIRQPAWVDALMADYWSVARG